MPWLDNESCVTRYSYFGIADNNHPFLESDGSTLSALGLQYTYTAYNSSCGYISC